ncbi:hypothetical protein, partial [Enterobacter hormaechei]|uniref:hypothetical protein n=1 Tax=Enterobacter hormaechei TaxID=158836 RepID=UPI001C66E32E
IGKSISVTIKAIIPNAILLLSMRAETEMEIMAIRETIPKPIILLMQSSFMLLKKRRIQLLKKLFIKVSIVTSFFLVL